MKRLLVEKNYLQSQTDSALIATIAYSEQAYTGDATFLARSLLDTIIQFPEAQLKLAQVTESVEEELETLIFKVYPIPTSDIVYFTPNIVSDFRVELIVTDVLGRVVLKTEINSSRNTIDTRILSDGLYTFSIRNNFGFYQNGKLIIAKK